MQPAAPSVKAIFDHAHELTAPGERQAYLDRACAGQPALRQQVELLLRALNEAGSFLETPAGGGRETASFLRPGLDESTVPPSPAAPGSATDGPGSQIGPYRLVRELGTGGMGAVYLAEQDNPIRRQVALKIIKPGMDSAQVIARFDAERQALTLMDHASIARVYDASTTAQGRPYFVMELVQGVPLTEFCDKRRLTVRERLGLFAAICHAVQHAHQKGVMHRDLKPSNILVALHDGKPVPKIIDFGLAKAIEQPLTDQPNLTQAGAIIGTLRYMSPEQADFSDQGVDTRTDVYSLGVVLYELLTGTTPLDLVRPRGPDGFLEAVLRIREEEAPRPSTRAASLGDALRPIAEARRTEPARLVRQLRSELDWIALKALEKDRERRYETASALARDVERYLGDEPVEACPPSTRYRLGKFARKHRGLLVSLGGILASLLLAVVALTWGLVEVNDAREGQAKSADLARQEQKKAEAAKDKAVAAQQRAHKGMQITYAGMRLLPRHKARLDDVQKRILRNMEQAYRSLEPDVAENVPAEAAELAFNLGTLANLRDAAGEAEPAYRRAIALYRKALADAPGVAEYRSELAFCYGDLGILLYLQGKRADAEAAYRQRLELLQGLVDEFPQVIAYRGELADAYSDVGVVRRDAKDYAGAANNLREAVRLGEQASAGQPNDSPYHIGLGMACHNLGNVVRDQGKPEVALPWYGRAIGLIDAMQPRPERATEYLRNAHWDRANALGQLGKHAAATADWRRAIELAERPARDHLQEFLNTSLMEQKLQAEAKPSAVLLYQGAMLNCRAMKAADAETEEKLSAVYGRRALDLLKQAGMAGWFRDPQRLKQLQTDPTFQVLPRADFAALLDGLRR